MKQVRIICFSPTGSTIKLARAVAGELGLPMVVNDCTMPEAREDLLALDPGHDEVLIFASPVYYGRVQEHAAACFAKLKGQGQAVLLLANYGNRHYDDALLEMYNLACAAAFVPVAGAAFVSEHSFSTDTYPMAADRPDADDMAAARRFGQEAAKVLAAGVRLMSPPPGNKEFKAYPDFHRAPVSEQSCTLCGLCATLCPVRAISLSGDVVVTEESRCIVCQACVKSCPEGARKDSAPGAIETREHLKKLGLTETRREPEFFGL